MLDGECVTEASQVGKRYLAEVLVKKMVFVGNINED